MSRFGNQLHTVLLLGALTDRLEALARTRVAA